MLGTFFGITIGLISFDTSDLDKSIPLLLEGLKTAFFASLAGMIGSLLLSRQVSTLYDNEDKGVSDVNQAAGLITGSTTERIRTPGTQQRSPPIPNKDSNPRCHQGLEPFNPTYLFDCLN